MSRAEEIKDLSPEQIGHYLCALTEIINENEDGCETCSVKHLCSVGKNGWIELLKGSPKRWERRFLTKKETV